MQYISTRGEAPVVNFTQALLAGLADDGGLYLPKELPVLSWDEIRALRGKSYTEIAIAILRPFIGSEITHSDFEHMVCSAYTTFHHASVCPLVQTNTNEFILELFHGPTLAFKDVAMQLLARLMDHVLSQDNKQATIVGATSGDTGGAAIEAFANCNQTDIFILFPHGRVSSVQQRQMTTSHAHNTHVLSVEGTFDDCQALVKDMFHDVHFRNSLSLSSVNSINWARIMPQIIYYFTAALSLGAPDRPVSFTVPTGNFGNIFAGYIAKRMGLPIERLVIASNDNDILPRMLETGVYETRHVIQTTSPSIDIQISSNFERLLFEVYERDANIIQHLMAELKRSGCFTIADDSLQHIRLIFDAGRSTVQETANTICEVFKNSGYLLDPHSAISVKVARDHKSKETPMVVLATAHPAKFPDAVRTASGIDPTLPIWLGDLMERKEHYTVLPNDLKIVKEYIRLNSRVAREGVCCP